MERFWSKVDKTPGHGPDGDCWTWTAFIEKTGAGYGQVSYERKVRRAHVVGFILQNGEVSKDLCVCHKCDNPICVRGDHLFLGTRKDNMVDMTNKGRMKGFGVKKECPDGMSWCSKCKQYLSLEDFHKNSKRWNKAAYICKSCIV